MIDKIYKKIDLRVNVQYLRRFGTACGHKQLKVSLMNIRVLAEIII